MSVQWTVIITTMRIFFPDVMLLYMYCLNVLCVSLMKYVSCDHNVPVINVH